MRRLVRGHLEASLPSTPQKAGERALALYLSEAMRGGFKVKVIFAYAESQKGLDSSFPPPHTPF